MAWTSIGTDSKDTASSAVPRHRVAVVDDDVGILSAVRRVLSKAGYDVASFSSSRAFLHSSRQEPPACVLLDVLMPDADGLEVQKLLRSTSAVQVVFMTAHEDVHAAIAALKGGAVDFLLKPFERGVLLGAVERAVQRGIARSRVQRAAGEARERLSALTPREKEVCALVASGLTTPEIAGRLGTAASTISLHRAHVMRKLQVRSVVELVRLVDLASPPEGP